MSVYLGWLAFRAEDRLEVFRGKSPKTTRIPYEYYCLWYEEAGKGQWKLDMAKLHACQHALRFHRPVDARLWKERVDGSFNAVCEFFRVTRDRETEPQLNDGKIAVAEVEAFIADMRQRCEMLRGFRNQLADQLSAEYLQMTISAPANFWYSLALSRTRIAAYFRWPPA